MCRSAAIRRSTSEFYQPLDALHDVVRRAECARRRRAICRSTRTTSQIADFRDREAEADLDIGRNLGNWGEIRVGLHRINGSGTRRAWAIRSSSTPQYNNGEFFFKFSYDRLDNVHFPREGQSFTLQWDADRTNLGSDYRLRQACRPTG